MIVSSKDSTTDSRLTERRDAIRAGVADLDCGGDLHVDFYDLPTGIGRAESVFRRQYQPGRDKDAAARILKSF